MEKDIRKQMEASMKRVADHFKPKKKKAAKKKTTKKKK